MRQLEKELANKTKKSRMRKERKQERTVFKN